MDKNYRDRLLRAEFDPSGGYDCITGAWILRTNDQLVAKIDLADFCEDAAKENPYSEGAMEARDVAMRLVHGYNALIDKEYIQ